MCCEAAHFLPVEQNPSGVSAEGTDLCVSLSSQATILSYSVFTCEPNFSELKEKVVREETLIGVLFTTLLLRWSELRFLTCM